MGGKREKVSLHPSYVGLKLFSPECKAGLENWILKPFCSHLWSVHSLHRDLSPVV